MMVNMLEAKTNLSKLIKKLETGEEDKIVLCRDGKPVAWLTPVKKRPRLASQAPELLMREAPFSY